MGYKINCTECMYKIVREGIHRIALHQKILILHEGEKERLVSISLPLFASVLFSHACFRKKNKEKEPTHWGRLQKQCINLTRWGRLQKHFINYHIGEGFKNIMLGKASKTSRWGRLQKHHVGEGFKNVSWKSVFSMFPIFKHQM